MFKLKDKDEPWVYLKHLVYYTLLWIACIDNYYNIYSTLKVNSKKFPDYIVWVLDELKYRNAKYIYSWHLEEV